MGLRTCISQKKPTVVKRKMRVNAEGLFYFRMPIKDNITSKSSSAVITLMLKASQMCSKRLILIDRAFAWYLESSHFNLGNCTPVKPVAVGNRSGSQKSMFVCTWVFLFPCSRYACCFQLFLFPGGIRGRNASTPGQVVGISQMLTVSSSLQPH